MMCFLALFGNVRAQETIEIGEDKTPAGGYNLPTYDFNQYSISQQIYTEAEMEGKTGNITDVSFRLSSSKSASVKRTYAVYIKSTDLTAFADGNSFFQLSESDKVFEGQVELPTAAGSWYTINFDTPFKYTGGNFMLCVYDKTGSQTSMSDFSMFYQYSTTENASIHKNAWGNTPLNVSSLSGGTVVASKNQIKLTFVAAEEEPDPTPDPEPDPDPTPDPEDPDDEQPEGLKTVEIGEDKQPVGNNYYLPTYDFVPYSFSQQLYFEEEFDDNFGAIHSVSFKVAYANNGQAVERTYEVYMKHTDRNDLTGAYEPITEADKVFEGTVEIPGTAGSWLKIPFDKAFDYSGGNVVLSVYDKTGKKTDFYHRFYQFQVDGNRAMYDQGTVEYDLNNLNTIKCNARTYVNQVKFEIGSKPIVKVVPETVELGEAMLGSFWTQKKPSQKVSVKTVSTAVTKIECDNDFFVLPENIDYTANPIVFDVTYDTTAQVTDTVKGKLTVTYEDGVVEVPMTALAYTPQEGDVYELAKEITFVERKYADTPKFDELHDNYFLPRERVDGNANDVVYSFELEEEKIIIAKVKGNEAKLSIYDSVFSAKGGPSNDNNYKGSVAAAYDFFYDFNDGFLIDWVTKSYDTDDKSWTSTSSYGGEGKQYGKDNTYCIISYSNGYNGQAHIVDNVIMTEYPYIITENSVLSFDAKTYDTDRFSVEVTKDGENYTVIENVTPTLEYQHYTIDLGAEFEALGLEYSDYHIVFRHKENEKLCVVVDNIKLERVSKTRAAEVSIYAVPYPAGKYYAVAAAESDFTFEMMLVNEDELPLAPENVVATTIDEFSIELSWNKAQNATSYNVYRNDELVANVKDTTYVDEDLAHNTDYCYVVRGYNDILESVPSAKACAKTNKLSLAIPDSIVAFPGSTSSIVLSWSKVDKAAGYEIYRGEDVIDVVEDTTYTVEGLMPGEECCCMVAAINRGVKSEKSDVVCANALNLEPGIPANLKVEATSTTSVVLTWDTTANAKRYYIYSADTLVAKTAYTTYNIVKLEYNTEYCFTVTAVNGELESEKSQEACGKTLGEGVEELSSSINVYPNPVENELILATELQVEEISIYDIYGRQAMRQQVGEATGQQVVDVADLEAGVYFVKIVTSNNEVVRRFVKK